MALVFVIFLVVRRCDLNLIKEQPAEMLIVLEPQGRCNLLGGFVGLQEKFFALLKPYAVHKLPEVFYIGILDAGFERQSCNIASAHHLLGKNLVICMFCNVCPDPVLIRKLGILLLLCFICISHDFYKELCKQGQRVLEFVDVY
ncbi:hypothetical protein SDC9_55192 [bioreactor metagenome]|uniref:Uncharacterized protein n=1 Tax=bioreactor metagenome TaxID=1076179 RepID=A0A644WY87_9ZZZZ